MRENNRKPIEKCRKKLPQFTTMNVIDGQAGLVIYSSLIFYSLTIDNILNIKQLSCLISITRYMSEQQFEFDITFEDSEIEKIFENISSNYQTNKNLI